LGDVERTLKIRSKGLIRRGGSVFITWGGFRLSFYLWGWAGRRVAEGAEGVAGGNGFSQQGGKKETMAGGSDETLRGGAAILGLKKKGGSWAGGSGRVREKVGMGGELVKDLGAVRKTTNNCGENRKQRQPQGPIIWDLSITRSPSPPRQG